GNAKRAMLGLGELECAAHPVERIGLHDAVDQRGAELPVQIVDQDAFGLLRCLLAQGERRRPHRAERGQAQKLAAIAHPDPPCGFGHSRMTPCKLKSPIPATPARSWSTRPSGRITSAGAPAAPRSLTASTSPTAARRVTSRLTATGSSWSSIAPR